MVVQFFDRYYAKNKAAIDSAAAKLVSEIDVEDLVEKYPKASDAGLLDKALRDLFVLSLDYAVESFPKAVEPYVRDVLLVTSDWWFEEAKVDNKGDIELFARVEGEWFEIPEAARHDPMLRIEVPAYTHDRDFERALRKAGAYSASASWSLESPEDPMFERAYDAVKYDLRAKWKVNWREMDRRYGRQAFADRFMQLVPRARAHVERRHADVRRRTRSR